MVVASEIFFFWKLTLDDLNLNTDKGFIVHSYTISIATHSQPMISDCSHVVRIFV